jgi:ketosteroid isomerase-like protein
MTTRETIQRYFDRLESRSGWDAVLADDIVFTSFTSPTKEVRGKEPYLAATKGFYSSIRTMQVRDLIIDGSWAVALTRYELQRPNDAASFVSDVAEVFTVKDDRIDSFGIYFDTAPFAK